MPYKTLAELPESVKNHLPRHAQEIYKSSFNKAWDEYKDPSSRFANSSREETAHRVAWAAVKKKYKKEGDTWKETYTQRISKGGDADEQ